MSGNGPSPTVVEATYPVAHTGLELAEAAFHRVTWVTHYKRGRWCPGCGADCAAVAVVRLVYTFEICTCREEVEYDHLYEQLWHRVCLEGRVSNVG